MEAGSRQSSDVTPSAPGRVIFDNPTAATAPTLQAGALVAAGGLRTADLLARLTPLRAGDPLGTGAPRPPPPPDPDRHDLAAEDAEYARSLLDGAARAKLDAEIASGGYMSIEQVRELLQANMSRESLETAGLDAEIISLLDARVNYKLFVCGGHVYTREELYEHFAFHELQTQPEAVFEQQEIGVFPPKPNSLKEELEFVARDAGDDSVEFVTVEDLVGRATRRNYRDTREPLRIVKTKVFVGRDRWKDFLHVQRFFRGMLRVSAAASSRGGGGFSLPLLLTGGGAAADSAEDLREDLRRREEEMRRREATLQESMRRIEAHLAQVEARLHHEAARPPTPPPFAPPAAAGRPPDAAKESDDLPDSVPL